MNLAELYDRADQLAGPKALAWPRGGRGAARDRRRHLSHGQARRFGRGSGIVGVCVIMALLWVVREQTVTVKKERTHHDHDVSGIPSATRLALLVGLIALPAAAAVVMWLGIRLDAAPAPRARSAAISRQGRRHLAQKDFEAALREYNEAIQTPPRAGRSLLPPRVWSTRDGREARTPWPISTAPSSATRASRRLTSSAARCAPKAATSTVPSPTSDSS